MTLVVNFYGGGTGKSTSAAYVFAKLKMRGVNAELVREVAKEWCWRGQQIANDVDQYKINAEQLDRESELLDRVELIVTDGPLYVNAFYADKYASEDCATDCFNAAVVSRQARNRDDMDVWLVRSKPYNAAGRYQNEEQAREVDIEQRAFLRGAGLTLLDRLVDLIKERLQLCQTKATT